LGRKHLTINRRKVSNNVSLYVLQDSRAVLTVSKSLGHTVRDFIPVEGQDIGPGTKASDGTPGDSTEEIDIEISSTTPLKKVMKEIGNVITCLYQLSIAIKSPAFRDRLEKMEAIDMSYFERLDIEHVQNKHQNVGEKYQYLLVRLGKANTKRRQLLKYHNDHHEKIVGRRIATEDEIRAEEEGIEGSGYDASVSNYYSEAPTEMRTTVSTLYEGNMDFVGVTPVNLDSRSEAGVSQTSYASSSTESGSLRVPPPPPGFDEAPFQCPYCFVLVETENRASWK
jgi:hypothetical protein